ncbi:octapeptide-repeat protein T2-like isoform X2 [Pleurodeles waltl]|uniref:octapeptide-repeat protein T2-like isoform X2 n=1 Tax=Pleurodeles waltl TaxID=8319 RepID=UPI0037098A2C
MRTLLFSALLALASATVIPAGEFQHEGVRKPGMCFEDYIQKHGQKFENFEKNKLPVGTSEQEALQHHNLQQSKEGPNPYRDKKPCPKPDFSKLKNCSVDWDCDGQDKCCGTKVGMRCTKAIFEGKVDTSENHRTAETENEQHEKGAEQKPRLKRDLSEEEEEEEEEEGNSEDSESEEGSEGEQGQEEKREKRKREKRSEKGYVGGKGNEKGKGNINEKGKGQGKGKGREGVEGHGKGKGKGKGREGDEGQGKGEGKGKGREGVEGHGKGKGEGRGKGSKGGKGQGKGKGEKEPVVAIAREERTKRKEERGVKRELAKEKDMEVNQRVQ